MASPGRAEDSPRVMLFSGRDLWGEGAFAYGGLLVAPYGFDEDGVLLKLLVSGGLYRYRAESLGGEQVIGAELAGQITPGWRIKRGHAEFKLFFGLDTQFHRLRPDDASNRLRGRSTGLRVAAELWYEPAPSLLITGDASLSSIATSNAARLAVGWKILDGIIEDGVYVGPELQFFGSDGYRHRRIGLHITSMKTGDTEWSASGGWARDSDGRSSPYVRLGLAKRL